MLRLAAIAVQPARFCLSDDDRPAGTPVYTLDMMFSENIAGGADRPLLIKCDVEGAELLVLKGATRLIGARAPGRLLSVHPTALPQYEHDIDGVRRFLRDVGYETTLLSVDHEEHWWCQPIYPDAGESR